MSGMFTKLAFLVLLISGVYLVVFKRRAEIPAHMQGNKVSYIREFITEEVRDSLVEVMNEMRVLSSNSNDAIGYYTEHEHVGEATPIVNGTCDHPYMIPDKAGENCIFPQRIDIARHYLLTGGVTGLKDPYHVGVSRLLSFGKFLFDLEKYPAVKNMFSSENFQNAAKGVCPEDEQVLDPFQFNFIVQLPGQTVATHIDASYFWGASRFQFPQWLLASMVGSNLFQDKFINQIQVVAYIHKWNDTNRDGSFIYWDDDNDTPKSVAPETLAASIVDGSKTLHAATVYQKHIIPPILDKSKKNTLEYQGNDIWHVKSDGELVKEYTLDDLRISIVYRGKCFASEEEKEKYHAMKYENMTLDSILDKFTEDLVSRGKLEQHQKIDRLDLALLIMDEYLKYPYPPLDYSIIPFNYCVATKLFPQLNILLKYIC